LKDFKKSQVLYLWWGNKRTWDVSWLDNAQFWSYAEGIHRKCRAHYFFHEGSITRREAYMSNQTHGPLSLGS
jgi:hypothetical protein